MNDIKGSGFKSYLDESGLETIKLNDDQQTKILKGEQIVCTATQVILYAPLSNKKKSTHGILTITTFKLSFASAAENENEQFYQQNLLLGVNDICLSSIGTIYQIGDRTRKKLLPGQNVSGKVKELLIVCKNMRSMEISFKDAEKDVGRTVTNALLHHAYPKRHSLLFAYDYKEPYIITTLIAKEVTLFRVKSEWVKELQRTGCQNWKISDVNLHYMVSPSLMEALIVPESVTSSVIEEAVRHFNDSFCPVWVWGTSKGAALVRMSDLLPAITDSRFENEFLESIRRSHPNKAEPVIINLNSPSAKDIQSSYLKLRDLCVPISSRNFKSQDFKFYGQLDSSKWLHHVSTCLAKAEEAANCLHKLERTVVLQEGNGHDLNCVISSLTQILLDRYFRTKHGFQSLVQKEWVALGHQFAFRLGHLIEKDVEQAPYFLLFLDCVWQIMQQHPCAFEFSEIYLTTLWDSSLLSIFDTFLFNNEHSRIIAESGKTSPKLTLRSVWDWQEQFPEKDILFFSNPLYRDNYSPVMTIKSGLPHLDIWSQCYFRWIPQLEIKNGGRPVIDLFNRLLVCEIWQLQQIRTGEFNGKLLEIREEKLELLKKVNSFFPFSHNQDNILLPINNIFLSNDTLDNQSMITVNND